MIGSKASRLCGRLLSLALRRSFCCTGHPTVIPPSAPRGGGAGVPLRRRFPYQGTHEKYDAHLICSGKKEAPGIMRGPPLQKSALPSQVDLFLPKKMPKIFTRLFFTTEKNRANGLFTRFLLAWPAEKDVFAARPHHRLRFIFFVLRCALQRV